MINYEINMLIHGIIIGICLGYLIFRPYFKYDKSKMCLTTKGIDKKNKDKLEKFINDCLDNQKKHLTKQIKGE